MKHDIDFELIDEMAECIYYCSWVSSEEIAAYIKSCITDGNYDPEEWSEEGRGIIRKERNLIEYG